jgi:uncharacterized protein (TIGR02594 family)
MDYYGLTEVVGVENNPQIVQFFKDIGHTWVQDDETAWCSAFINWLAWDCGCQRSGKLDARSWLTVGKTVKYPELGDIVVFWSGNPDPKISWRGHVGLFMGLDFNKIYCFGGNQGNQVNITPYPLGQLLGYRCVEYIQ